MHMFKNGQALFSVLHLSQLSLCHRFGDVSPINMASSRFLLINGFGIATSVFLMGFVDSVEAFFLLRLLNGVVTGFIPTSLAFISSQTAKKEAGKMLGTLQMGSVTGTLFGPVFGGLLADAFGFPIYLCHYIHFCDCRCTYCPIRHSRNKNG